ncbi:MAG: DUF3667 domain-containing protein [Caulobacter sp.]|nr:DUF3667 domain-containing protein [Caulobacter sp.]
MTGELEAAVADSFTDVFRRKQKPFTKQGQPCANCGTPLEGPYCHACGQNSDTHHRTILHLIWEAIEGMFHLDGRLARTLPLLFFKPGVLAKDYMEGRIARHVPPFRTFLVALLLFIFAAEHAIHGLRHHQELKEEQEAAALATPQGRKAKADEIRQEAGADRQARLKEAVADRDEDLKDPDEDKARTAQRYDEHVREAQERYAAEIVRADALEKNPNAGADYLARHRKKGDEAADQIRALNFESADKLQDSAQKLAQAESDGDKTGVVAPKLVEKAETAGAKDSAKHWFKDGLAKALENPEYYLLVMFGWAHRLAVLLLPILGLSLAFVYMNKRQYFIYDHLIVATNLLSFSFLTWAIVFVAPAALAGPLVLAVLVWTPINLFQTLRGGYGSSIIGAGLKTLVVWFMSVFSFGTLLTALLLFTLSQM